MKLSKLNPRWITLPQWASPDPFYIGVSFICPHCGIGPCVACGKFQDYRLAVRFWPPIDPKNLMGNVFANIPDPGGHRRISGETFDTLSLSPSIGFDDPPHFHGFITNGEVLNNYPNAEWTKNL